MGLLGKRIACQRTLELISKALVNLATLNKQVIPSHMGTHTHSRSVLKHCPIISNIVLHQLDLFMAKTKASFDCGKSITVNPKYHSINKDSWKANNSEPEQRIKHMVNLPYKDVMDPNYKRVMYVRYADDFVILTISSMADCFTLRRKVKDFLHNKLGLELNLEKTSIKSLKEGSIFLGAKLIQRGKVIIRIKSTGGTGVIRRLDSRLSVLAPLKDLTEKLTQTGFARRNHLNQVLAKGRRDLVNLTHHEILKFFNARING